MSDHSMDSDPSIAGSPSPEPSASNKGGDKTKKRSSSNADSNAPAKVTKRRAARACVSCRARKVRCDVVEGAPCGNCRWDNVECVVQESRRRKKSLFTASTLPGPVASAEAQELRCKTTPTNGIPTPVGADMRRPSSGSAMSASSIDAGTTAATMSSSGAGLLSNGSLHQSGGGGGGGESHVPHMIYQRSGYRHDPTLLSKSQPSDGSSRTPWSNLLSQANLFNDNRTAHFLNSLEEADPSAQLPHFVRPLPRKIDAEDVKFLHTKGALALPGIPLQNALIRAYIEYVHPYMPLMDLHDFLNIVDCREGLNGQTSLLLYQAVMFSATAFIDMRFLREEGYTTRKAARKAFFQKTRLLYDFDYESDRLVLVQALLLMTYWYETPDDQKDTWHWMGVAISLAHTIGLHRNPKDTSMATSRKKLWKRIWWSCFMRDRLVALGMRRPTRIKNEDFDVPMLLESDFEIEALSENTAIVPPECTLMRDVGMQRELAIMCIAKAQLCVCISHMLKAQYSVLIRDNMKPENTTNSTMMLFPRKKLDNLQSVHAVDMELMAWAEALPASCRYRTLTPLDIKDGKSTIAVQRTLLHMVYFTTISALHRPQFLPSSPLQAPTTSRQVQEMSRLRVRDAAMHITRMANELHSLRLERYLPTTGVTVILPAMIIHLLEMKNPTHQARDHATRGFRQCMRVMEKLREVYAAADYATGFLDAALRKAAIDINGNGSGSTLDMMKRSGNEFVAQATPPPDNAPYMTAAETLFNEKRRPAMRTMMPPNTVNAAALDLSATDSPPQDFDSAAGGLTPSASGGSDEAHLELDVDAMDLDFMQGHDEFDWNAVAGTDFDVDQWLQFPAEGVATAEENLMAAGVYCSNGGNEAEADQSFGYLANENDEAVQGDKMVELAA